MKNMRIKLLIVPFLFLSCTNATKTSPKTTNVIHFDSGFSLYQDTIFVNIKGEMTHALKYHDKFYVLFEQKVLKYGGHGKRWLYIFSNGEIEKTIECPKKMDAVYWDFFVKNDSIILKQYMDDVHFYFDAQNFTWKEIAKVDDLIFEDEKFYVYSLDFGEWGGKTWFKDKKTGIEYAIEATTPLVNKIDSIYYLTNSFKVLKIENPLNLNKCDDDVTYTNIEKDAKYAYWYGKPIGFHIAYQDTTYDYFDFSYHPKIVSSFVWQGELLHIYETDTETYIAKTENNSIKSIQKIGKDLRFYDWYYSYRCKNLNGNNELLKFRTKDEQSFGLIEIIENKIFVHYFTNNAELKPKTKGQTKADDIFVNRLNFILADLGNLQLETVDLSENKWGSFDITPTHKIGIGESYYPNPNKYELDTAKSYLIQEDSLISNSIRYYATKENGLIRVVSCDWEETDFLNPNLKKQATEVFKRKILFLEDCFTQKVGKPTHVEEKENYKERTWKASNGFTIHLENMTNFNRIRLIIYKD
jgi:hypothetical protein